MTTVADHRDVILAPVVYEKAYGLLEQGVYTFQGSATVLTCRPPSLPCRRVHDSPA